MIDRELLAQVRRIQVRTDRLVTDVMAGGYSSVFRGSGIEFDEVREFTEGDSLRSVDWNVTARMGRPFIKKFVEERELTVLFVLDASASTGFGTSPSRRGVQTPTPGARITAPQVRTVRETAAEFCACLSLAASRNNDKAGMVAFSDRLERYVPAKKGTSHVLRLIREALALAPVGRATDLAAALDYTGRVQRKRAVCFLVSDFQAAPDSWQKSVRLLSRRHDVIAVRLSDPRTRELPNAGLLRLRDLETGREVLVDSASRRVRREYARRVQAQTEAADDAFKRSSVDVLNLSTHGSIADPIVRFFRMREMRGGRR